jgi:uncharacterized membrane protein YfcA
LISAKKGVLRQIKTLSSWTARDAADGRAAGVNRLLLPLKDMDITAAHAALVGLVFLAFLTESIVGFGATILTVTLVTSTGLLPLETLLPAFVPLNLLLSGVVLYRSSGALARRALTQEILPATIIGMVIGIATFRVVSASVLLLLFGVFVFMLSARELLKLRHNITSSKLPTWRGRALLLAGGVIHGMFGSGGPLLVYVLSRRVEDPHQLRSTMATLWLLLNGLLVIGYLQQGSLTTQTAAISLMLIPSLAAALWLGEKIYRSLPASKLRTLTWVVLLVASSLRILSSLS